MIDLHQREREKRERERARERSFWRPMGACLLVGNVAAAVDCVSRKCKVSTLCVATTEPTCCYDALTAGLKLYSFQLSSLQDDVHLYRPTGKKNLTSRSQPCYAKVSNAVMLSRTLSGMAKKTCKAEVPA